VGLITAGAVDATSVAGAGSLGVTVIPGRDKLSVEWTWPSPIRQGFEI
jgi:hypothetical protein